MNPIKMNAYGIVLTGREFGKNAGKEMAEKYKPPYYLDFAGVVSMGSSFGDEIFRALTQNSEDKITVLSASKVVQESLLQIQSDLKIQIKFT